MTNIPEEYQDRAKRAVAAALRTTSSEPPPAKTTSSKPQKKGKAKTAKPKWQTTTIELPHATLLIKTKYDPKKDFSVKIDAIEGDDKRLVEIRLNLPQKFTARFVETLRDFTQEVSERQPLERPEGQPPFEVSMEDLLDRVVDGVESVRDHVDRWVRDFLK